MTTINTKSKPKPRVALDRRWASTAALHPPLVEHRHERACWAGLQLLAAWANQATSGRLFRDRHRAAVAAGVFREAAEGLQAGVLGELHGLLEERDHEEQARFHQECSEPEPWTGAALADELLQRMEGHHGDLPAVDVEDLRAALTRVRDYKEPELPDEWPTAVDLPKLIDMRDRLLKESKLCISALTDRERFIYDAFDSVADPIKKATVARLAKLKDNTKLGDDLTNMRRRGILVMIGKGGRTATWKCARLPD